MIHFMSVLGTSNYSECTYVWHPAFATSSGEANYSAADYSYEKENSPYHTDRFVQLASLKKILQENPGQSVKISVFLTPKARKENWEYSGVDSLNCEEVTAYKSKR